MRESDIQELSETLIPRGRADPAWWIREVLGIEPWSIQARIAESVRDYRETAVKSCHAAGKSFTAAGIALWWLYCHPPSIVITTAPTDRQVRGILWKEIRNNHGRAPYRLDGEILSQELRLDNDWWAWGFTAPANDPDRFQGFHSRYTLVVVDEASGVSEDIYDAIDGVLTADDSRLLMIGNPTNPTGRFAKAFTTPGVSKISVSAFDTPNFTEYGITEDDIATGSWSAKVTGDLPSPYLVTPRWVADRYQRWRPESSVYKAKVLAEFPAASADTLIPLHLIEAAVSRQIDPGEPVEIGADIARFGSDETVIVLRRGNVARIVAVIPSADTMETAGRIVNAAHGAATVKIDADGLGAGVYDRAKELGLPAREMQSGRAARDTQRFANARAEWWWGLRERFESGDIDIEDDETLISQLSNMKYKINSRGQVLIESKEDMKKRGIGSPDRADGLMFAFAVPVGPSPSRFHAVTGKRSW